MSAAVPIAAAGRASPQKGVTRMTGPGLALIIIPITTTTGLVVWLTMVFSADSRPRRADRNPLGTHASTPGQTAECLPGAAATANRAHRGSGERHRAGHSRTAA